MTIEILIDNLLKDLANELTHMMCYIEYAAAVTGSERTELREFFLKQAKSEMEHVDQFKRLIIGLGARKKMQDINERVSSVVPRSTIVLKGNKDDMLKNALALEEEVVHNYIARILDAQELQKSGYHENKVDGKYVEMFLEEQMMHSREDADELLQMLNL